jgi:hypothetical protein
VDVDVAKCLSKGYEFKLEFCKGMKWI